MNDEPSLVIEGLDINPMPPIANSQYLKKITYTYEKLVVILPLLYICLLYDGSYLSQYPAKLNIV